MYDYRLLESLMAVARNKGFERAAEQLCVTQSAVSQRIRLLEEQSGMILVTRTTPVRATEAGKRLIRLCREVQLLEQELVKEQQQEQIPLHLTIGVNADSLATWFLPAVSQLLEEDELLIEILSADQSFTMSMLQSGEAVGCVSSSSRALQGCRCIALGSMRYVPVAAPGFSRRWLPEGWDEAAVLKAPGVVYDRDDMLHREFLSRWMNAQTPVHGIPSSEKFLEWILLGHAWGMVPLIQCSEHLDDGRIVLLSQESLDVPLYWHRWNMDSQVLKVLSSAVIEHAGRSLLPPCGSVED